LNSIKLWRHLFGDRRGYLCLTTAQRKGGRFLYPIDTYFEWPEEAASAALKAAEAAGQGLEVYFVATMLREKSRKKAAAAEPGALWVDGDEAGDTVPSDVPAPTAEVESSPGRRHWYWRLDRQIDPREAEVLNQRLAYAIGADKGGWDATQLLRVPGTRNHKYSEAPEVKLLSINEEKAYSTGEIADALNHRSPVQSHAVSNNAEAPSTHNGPPVQLSSNSRAVWDGQKPKLKDDGSVDRSETLYKIGAVLAEAGATEATITRALEERDINLGYQKYTDRSDKAFCYAQIAEKVLKQCQHRSKLPADLFEAVLTEEKLTDQRVAECVSALNNNEILYAPDRGQWLEWSGKRWVLQTDAGVVRQRIIKTARLLQRLVLDNAQRGRTHRDRVADTLNIEANRRVEGIVRTMSALPELRRNVGDFDADLMLMNVQNGTIELHTGHLREHRPDDLITQITSTSFDATAKATRWMQFLQEIFCGDQELIDFVQRVVGYSLTGIKSEKALFILHGSGQNGKSVFLETLRNLLGGYVGSLDPGDLIRHRNDRHPAGLAKLAGTRIAYAQETAEGSRLNEALIKALTGGDTITVRRMHQNPWDMRPTFTLFMSTNSKPLVYEQGSAIWDRLKPIPFRYKVPPELRVNIDQLLHHFVEVEGAGVLAWAVEGCLKYLQDGRLVTPDVIRKEVEEYRADMDMVGQFLEQECVETEGVKVPKSELYTCYQAWCDGNGYIPLKAEVLWRKLKERGFQERSMRRHRLKVRCWEGLGLRSELGPEAESPKDFRPWGDGAVFLNNELNPNHIM
jgi:P4 family phage/plasmid primase-like protien